MARRRPSVAEGAPPDERALGWTTLAIGLAVATTLLWKNGGWSLFRTTTSMGWEEYYLFNIALLLLPAFVTIVLFFRRDLSEFGMTGGEVKWGTLGALAGWLLFLPVLFLVAPQKPFQQYYLYQFESSRVLMYIAPGQHQVDWGRFAFHQMVMCFYMLAWEWFFRGFLLNGVRKIAPVWVAIAVQAALFCLLHLGKPPIEVISSLAGGIVLGVAALRFRSMLPCFLIHYLISLSFDASILYYHLR